MLCEDILVKIENILRKESVILHARARCWSGSVPIITPERRLEQTAQRCAEEIMKGLPTSSMASSQTLCSRNSDQMLQCAFNMVVRQCTESEIEYNHFRQKYNYKMLPQS